MAHYWWIAKRKFKLTAEDQIHEKDIIENEKWMNVVESDPTLYWFEETPHGKEMLEFCKKNGNEFSFKSSAHFQINKNWGHGGLQILLNREGHYLSTLSSRITTKRIEKLKEIANKLECKLFRNRTEIDDEKYQFFLGKYKT